MRAACPSCQQALEVPESALGKKVRCPGCNAVFVAEDTAAAPLPSSPSRKRPRPNDEDDFDDREDEDRPARRRSYYDDDDDPADTDAAPPHRGGGAAIVSLVAAGLYDLAFTTFNLATTIAFAEPPPVPNPEAHRIGQIVGGVCCMGILLPMVIFMFIAANNVRTGRSRGLVITGAVMAFILGTLYLLGGILNGAALFAGPPLPNMLATLAKIQVLLSLIAIALNVGAGILALVALNSMPVPRRARKRLREDDYDD